MNDGTPRDYLTPILERKARENVRRKRHLRARASRAAAAPDKGAPAPGSRAHQACGALRREPGQLPRVIAEIKRRSPSAGVIRPYARGDIRWLTAQYISGGAAAISVLCDRAGFDGSALDLRRAAAAATVPLLFKEFVLDEVQVALARSVGAHMVLLVARALSPERLRALCDAVAAAGMAPVVEAANEAEVDAALSTSARIIGVNARDLRTFRVDVGAAHALLRRIPSERIAVHMSGVRSAADYREVAAGRADAVLIGEGLMRAAHPEAKLREWLEG